MTTAGVCVTMIRESCGSSEGYQRLGQRAAYEKDVYSVALIPGITIWTRRRKLVEPH
jgi:hypothetical protein